MMVPKYADKLYLDPIEELDETLEYTWNTLCDYFIAGGCLPELRILFRNTDVNSHEQVAEGVLANMLFELMEGICRFSPWYTKPSRAFGIEVFRDLKARQFKFKLMPEAVQKWEFLISPLTKVIRQNKGMIQAITYVETLIGNDENDECVTASCACNPPHTIRLYQSTLMKMEIYCNVCKLPFT